ncbi:AaceriAFR709Cp [[Ashbya] aceris (nom. inval.)]|nr:AaceriAFR709Cp [[Ashbya] aceris (nom. inval.)]
MGFLTDHQHTLITDVIDKVVTSERYTLEVELERLVHLIRAESEYEYTHNQLEAARALRKQLKYGNVGQQLRALELLNLFVSQQMKFAALYNDAKLLQRLQGIAMNTETDSRGRRYESRVVKRCVGYVLAWAGFLEGRSRAYEGLVRLGGVVRRNYVRKTGSNRRGGFLHDSADGSIHPDDALRSARADLAGDEGKIKLLISDAVATALALQNALLALPAGTRAVDNAEASEKFTQARELRRKVLRYLQLVTGGDLLGPLIHANEELVAALMRFDELSSTADSSGSSDESEDTALEDPFGDQNKI